ncbi:hypothetical protein VA7868_03913 [Vibrio aerogenes CECT 7868]|uniref:Lipoprotein n=1 Tax=Vibrio aerogenes CECT 7868 TaxID=1216006 RepID=A0A1M6C0E3_9VIBR|nr:DUF6694 family lipoprotein [Vibrio aerogenes]SHI54457.1 hypothetical protein VA7868_03913 [Vibrio aerogenes CECT 7868]
MKKFLVVLLGCYMLAGCFEPVTFDASNESTMKTSSRKIAKALPENQKEEFSRAVMYFSMGGTAGLKQIMTAVDDAHRAQLFAEHLAVIDGLTGDEILEKYRNVARTSDM